MNFLKVEYSTLLPPTVNDKRKLCKMISNVKYDNTLSQLDTSDQAVFNDCGETTSSSSADRQEVELSALSPIFRFISRRTLVQFSAVAVDHFSRKEEMCQTKLYLCHSALNTSLVPFHFLPNIQSQHYLVSTVSRLTCLKTPVYKKFGSHLKQGK